MLILAIILLLALPEPDPNGNRLPSLEQPAGRVVRVAIESDLQKEISSLQSGTTILIQPGTYILSKPLALPQGLRDVSVRGDSQDANRVILQGRGMNGPNDTPFGIWAKYVTNLVIANLTLRDVSDDLIIFNEGVQNPVVHNVRLLNSGDQSIKVNPDGKGGGVDNGVIRYCYFGYSALFAPDYYIAAVDIHTGNNWIIENCVIERFRQNPAGTRSSDTHPAILAWNGSRNTIVRKNLFRDNDRDISLGLYARSQDQASRPDHKGGIIENNMIFRAAETKGDVPIMVTGPGTKIHHNTIYTVDGYPHAVEYRFSTTVGLSIVNNLTNGGIIQAREGAEATLAGNVFEAKPDWFRNIKTGDLHLQETALAALDQGKELADTAIDYDGQARPRGKGFDVGADER